MAEWESRVAWSIMAACSSLEVRTSAGTVWIAGPQRVAGTNMRYSTLGAHNHILFM